MSDPIRIIETPQFIAQADKLLTDIQLKALRHLLASDPAAGIPLESHPEILSLEWQPKLNILYLVSRDLTEIGPDDQEDFKSKAISDHRNSLKKIGIGVAIKEVIEIILNLFK